MNLQAEADFFRDITPKVRKLVLSFNGKASVAQYKKIIGDYATEVDVAVEKLIVNELQKRFPNDHVMAEEEHSDTKIPSERIWIIDPICGTTNLGRGLKSFCTNIALADNQKLIAACVIDHSQDEYFWSIGNSELYINARLFRAIEAEAAFGSVVDIDFGSLGNVGLGQKKKLIEAALKLSQEPGFMLQSLNTSLGFAYTAVGKIDGFINVFNHPWDICAASFLIQQSGGVITDLEGKPWEVSSIGAIGARNTVIHKKLLEAFSTS